MSNSHATRPYTHRRSNGQGAHLKIRPALEKLTPCTFATEGPKSSPPKERATSLRRSAMVAVALLLSVPVSVVASAAPASAADSNCTRTSMNAQKGFSAFVLREGVGLVGWRDYLSIRAADRCDHGGLGVGVSIDESNVRLKGGRVVIGSVRFQTSLSSTWKNLNRLPGTYLGTSTGYSVAYGDGGHVDLNRNARITKVRLLTHLNFSGAIYAGRSYTCDLVNRSCS